MGNHPRKADGRRLFSAESKRATVQRVPTGEKTIAALSRELDIQPSVIRNWKRHYEAGATTAVAANEDVVPASQLREAYGASGSSSGRWGADPPRRPGARKKTPSLRRESGR
jgi:transposase-like protein